MNLTLRPIEAADLPQLSGGDSPFDDFGPRPPGRPDVPSHQLDVDGGLAVVGDGAVLGMVSWHWVQWGPNSASRCPMIGIWLARQYRGRGYGAKAQHLLIDMLFRHLPVNRVEAHTDVDNLAEQRALQRAGMVAEGIVRGAQWRDGRYRDGYLYSVLRAEWQTQRSGSAPPGRSEGPDT